MQDQIETLQESADVLKEKTHMYDKMFETVQQKMSAIATEKNIAHYFDKVS